MKKYTKPIAPYMMRVKILKKGFKPKHICFIDTTQEECLTQLKRIIENHSIKIPIGEKYVTNVEIREGEGSFNGKCISFSFKGLSPSETLELFEKEFNK